MTNYYDMLFDENCFCTAFIYLFIRMTCITIQYNNINESIDKLE